MLIGCYIGTHASPIRLPGSWLRGRRRHFQYLNSSHLSLTAFLTNSKPTIDYEHQSARVVISEHITHNKYALQAPFSPGGSRPLHLR